MKTCPTAFIICLVVIIEQIVEVSTKLFARSKEDAAVDAIVDAFEQWRYENSPEYAAGMGVTTFDHNLVSYDIAIYKHRAAVCRGFLAGLENLDASKLEHDSRLTYDVLVYTLKTYSEMADQFIEYGNLNPLNFLENSWFSILAAWIPAENSELTFRMHLSILHAWRVQGLQIEYLMRRSAKLGRAYFYMSIKRLLPIIEQAIAAINSTDAINDTLMQILDAIKMSETFTPALRRDLEAQLRYSITNVVYPAMLRMQQFIIKEYLPKCRTSPGVAVYDRDHRYYAACVRWHTSLDNLTPEAVHQLGLREVERIGDEMRQIIRANGGSNATTIVEFSKWLSADNASRATDEDDLLDRYADIVTNVISPALPKVFHQIDIPTSQLEILSLGFDGPDGMYGSGNGTGRFYVNTNRASQRPLYTMMSLALHEGNPGHHLQFESSVRLHVPNFRRQPEYGNIYAVPVMFPFHNAFVEGWGLYAESLGYADYLDVIHNDKHKYGVLTWEMFRACRLVVDSGMHFYNWSRDKAIMFMHNNSGVSIVDITQEIDRYSTWPGQALGYKLGEITIKRLRDEARAALGQYFDIRDFHHAVLANGPLPLGLLEAEIKRWVNSELVKRGKRVNSAPLTFTKNPGIVLLAFLLIQASISLSTKSPSQTNDDDKNLFYLKNSRTNIWSKNHHL